MAQKIAFIRKGTVPLASAYVAQALQENFPQFSLEIIDVKQLLSRQHNIAIHNARHMFKAYGVDILLRKKSAKDCFFRTPYIFQKIKSLLSEELADPAYVFSFQMQSLYDASRSGLPHFVYTDHTNLANLLYPIQEYGKLFSKSWIGLERTIYENACHIFTRSSNITHSLLAQYGCDADKVTCVYAGSNVHMHHRNLENERYGRKNILFVGIDWERKGGPELVAAFRQVLAAHPDAHLTIVGCSPQLDVPNCEIVGRIPLQQIDAYYRNASLFCLPTRLEPFGIAFIEAFSYKLPVIATPVGAIPDFVIPGENGYLVPPGEVDCLANTLIQLLADPARCQLFGQRGYNRVQENYTWEKVGRRLKERIVVNCGLQVASHP